MIGVEEAKKLLKEIKVNQIVSSCGVRKALSHILAEDVLSPFHQPAFDNSSMDGYAISGQTPDLKSFEVIGEIRAGQNPTKALGIGEAMRIFTGAKLPAGADTILIQENVEVFGHKIRAMQNYSQGDFVRKTGSMMKKGDLALAKGQLLNPASISYLASMGYKEIRVYDNPKVSLLATGDELVMPGKSLKSGQIYESNTFALEASLANLGIKPQRIYRVKDKPLALSKKIETALQLSEILILTGGISVGKYDLVYETLMKFGVETLFYKVAQKPGKPFFCGKLNGKYIFALPGNPAAVLVCFYEYILPFIKRMQGFNREFPDKEFLNLLSPIQSRESRAQFIRARANEAGVRPLEGQDSFMLHSFSLANALIYVPAGTHKIEMNQLVEVHKLW